MQQASEAYNTELGDIQSRLANKVGPKTLRTQVKKINKM